MSTVSDAIGLIRDNRLEQAERLLRAELDARRESLEIWLVLGQLQELKEQFPEAIESYRKASALNASHGLPFTRQAIIRLRHHLGIPKSVPPAGANSRPAAECIAMSTLGTNGRFGNQLLQYGFLRMYAKEYDLQVEVPEWIGRYLFDLHDPYPSPALPVAREDGDLFARSLNREADIRLAGHDLWGYCNYHTALLKRYRSLFRELYRPGIHFRPMCDELDSKYAALGKTLVALHLRRGDFGQGKFWIAPTTWYTQWLDTVWDELDDPFLYIASDEPEVVTPAFARFQPVTSNDLVEPLPGAEFFPDFYTLTRADWLAISNSSFSFAAAMLNEGAEKFMRPDRRADRLRPFTPWNAEVFLP